MWIELCAPLIKFMTLVRYWPCLPPGSRSGVSSGVTLSERLLNDLAATGVPAALCATDVLAVAVVAIIAGCGGDGLVSLARLACASTMARTVAFAVNC